MSASTLDRARLRGPGRQGRSEPVRGRPDAAVVEGQTARLDRPGGPLAETDQHGQSETLTRRRVSK